MAWGGTAALRSQVLRRGVARRIRVEDTTISPLARLRLVWLCGRMIEAAHGLGVDAACHVVDDATIL